MRVVAAEFVQGFMRLGDGGWQMGWHERNGGNLSYRIRKEEIEQVRSELSPGGWLEIGTSVPKLAGEYFLVTGTGRYFQNILRQPEETFGIIEIDDIGEHYRICWGLINGGRPTSELPSHLMNHEVKLEVTNGKHRVIYHCHPVNTIALTFVLPLKDEVFTRELWEMMTECPVIFPEGIGVIDWMVPGGREIAVKTSQLMRNYNVAIWAHHGMFCSGASFDETFGLMHTVEKSAEILLKVMPHGKRQSITPDNFRALAKDFNLTLPERFLY